SGHVGMAASADSIIAKHKLLLYEGLIWYSEDKEFNPGCRVNGYTFETMRDGELTRIEVKGPFFTREVKQILQSLPANTTIKFTRIIVSVPPNWCNRNYGQRTYLIK